MALNTVRQYVGARYVPKFAEPLEWQANTSYEALTVVNYNNDSYTSKIPVPANIGNPADNKTYWALTGNYNGQIEEYRKNIESYQNDTTEKLNKFSDDIEENNEYINNIKDIGTDFNSNVSPISKSTKISTVENFIMQGFTIVNGTGYIGMYSNASSRVYRYPNILSNGNTDSYIELPSGKHPNNITYNNGYLYITDSTTNEVYTIAEDSFTYIGKSKLGSLACTTGIVLNDGNDNFFIFDDGNQDVLGAITVSVGDTGLLTLDGTNNKRFCVSTNNNHSYTQGSCLLPNNSIALIRSYADNLGNSYLMFINPKNSSMRHIVNLPNDTEYEDLCVYGATLYVLGSNATIYNLGAVNNYYFQRNNIISSASFGRTGIYHYRGANKVLDFSTKNFSRGTTYGMTVANVHLMFSGHNPITLCGATSGAEDMYLTGIGIRATYEAVFLYEVNVTDTNIHVAYHGAIINNTHYGAFETLPTDEQPSEIVVDIMF